MNLKLLFTVSLGLGVSLAAPAPPPPPPVLTKKFGFDFATNTEFNIEKTLYFPPLPPIPKFSEVANTELLNVRDKIRPVFNFIADGSNKIAIILRDITKEISDVIHKMPVRVHVECETCDEAIAHHMINHEMASSDNTPSADENTDGERFKVFDYDTDDCKTDVNETTTTTPDKTMENLPPVTTTTEVTKVDDDSPPVDVNSQDNGW